MDTPETPPGPVPVAVFLDTSVFVSQHYNFASAAFGGFLPLFKRHGMKLLMPDPTEKEVRRHLVQRVNDALVALKSIRKRAPFLTKWRHFPKEQPAEWEPVHEALKEWQTFLTNLGAVPLDYVGVASATESRCCGGHPLRFPE